MYEYLPIRVGLTRCRHAIAIGLRALHSEASFRVRGVAAVRQLLNERPGKRQPLPLVNHLISEPYRPMKSHLTRPTRVVL